MFWKLMTSTIHWPSNHSPITLPNPPDPPKKHPTELIAQLDDPSDIDSWISMSIIFMAPIAQSGPFWAQKRCFYLSRTAQ